MPYINFLVLLKKMFTFLSPPVNFLLSFKSAKNMDIFNIIRNTTPGRRVFQTILYKNRQQPIKETGGSVGLNLQFTLFKRPKKLIFRNIKNCKELKVTFLLKTNYIEIFFHTVQFRFRSPTSKISNSHN